jgi:hypothetical protein
MKTCVRHVTVFSKFEFYVYEDKTGISVLDKKVKKKPASSSSSASADSDSDSASDAKKKKKKEKKKKKKQKKEKLSRYNDSKGNSVTPDLYGVL